MTVIKRHMLWDVFLIVMVMLLASGSALADRWALPKISKFFSPNKQYKLILKPNPTSNWSKVFSNDDNTKEEYFSDGELLELIIGPAYLHKWKVRLVNSYSPVSAIISNTGKYVVTFDNWHHVGYGDNVVVIYGAQGKLLFKYALEDILTDKEIKNSVPHTVSSRWWHKGEHKLNHEGKHYIDEQKGLLVLLTVAGKRFISLKDGKVIK